MNKKIHLRYLFFILLFSLFFISKGSYVYANEIVKYRAITGERKYDPVEAYNGRIIYNVGRAVVHVEFDESTHVIDYSEQIDLAVDFWRAFIRNVYPQLDIRRVRPGEQANFFIGHSSSLNMIAGRAGVEPAISYIPQTAYINSIVFDNYDLVNQYGIYIDNYLVGMNEERMELIMRTFRDTHNRGEAVRRYMYILLIRHLGYALGFVPDNSEISLFSNNTSWYSPEIYYISLNDSLTPRLMYRNNTFDYIEDLVQFNDEEDAFSIHDIQISPQEEIVARMCLSSEEVSEQFEAVKELYQMCNSPKITYPLVARIMAIFN